LSPSPSPPISVCIRREIIAVAADSGCYIKCPKTQANPFKENGSGTRFYRRYTQETWESDTMLPIKPCEQD
jgi:hypothetical protein